MDKFQYKLLNKQLLSLKTKSSKVKFIKDNVTSKVKVSSYWDILLMVDIVTTFPADISGMHTVIRRINTAVYGSKEQLTTPQLEHLLTIVPEVVNVPFNDYWAFMSSSGIPASSKIAVLLEERRRASINK